MLTRHVKLYSFTYIDGQECRNWSQLINEKSGLLEQKDNPISDFFFFQIFKTFISKGLQVAKRTC
jgi:hypothetical protein